MSTATKQSRLRMIALAVAMTLLASLAAVAAYTSGTPARAIQNNPELIGAAANPFYVYVKEGEWISAAGTASWDADGGRGLQRIVDPDGNIVTIPEGGQSFTQQATSDGVWRVHYDVKYPHGTWHIRVTDQASGGGNYRSGRVWAETYHMTDSDGRADNDHEFWVIDDSGYRYKLDLYGYTGINSTVSATALGITTGDECTPYYGSISTIGVNNPEGFRTDCGSPFRLFFEEPAEDLPISSLVDGAERWIAPPELTIDELTSGTIDFTPRTDVAIPGAGTITTTVDPRFQGGYFVEIDADGDGDFNGSNDRRVQVSARGGGAYSYDFDGLDNEGNPLPACTPMSARMTFESVGEIHVVQVDVEGRSGIGFQKLNGIHATPEHERTVFWNDTGLPRVGSPPNGIPINGILPPYDPDGTLGTASGPGVHGWAFALDSWGDNRVIEDWTYTPLQSAYSEPATFTSYCPQPAIEIGKASDFGADSKPGDVITYSVTATNTGDGAFEATNPAVIFDDIAEVLDDADFDITSLRADKPGELDYQAPLISWVGELAAGETVTIAYEVTLKGGGDGTVQNIAWNPEDPNDGEPPAVCAPDDSSCEEIIATLPKLIVGKEASSSVFTGPGDTTLYTVTVINPGPGDFTALNPATMTDDLTDVLASGRVVDTPSATVGEIVVEGTTLNWSGVLSAGESVAITYEVEYTATYDNEQDALLENTACVPEEHLAQGAEACASVEIPGPLLSMWKSVESDDDPVVAGSRVQYTLHFENSGQAAVDVHAVDHLDSVLDDAMPTITDDPDSPLTVTTEGTKLIVTGTLASGETETVNYTVIPDADGNRTDSVLTNFLKPEGEEPPTDGVCIPTNKERPDCTTTEVFASILLEKRGQGPDGVLPLAGAEFSLLTPSGDTISITDEITRGVFLIEGLAPGEYTLMETQSPEGYTLLADAISFEILATGALSADATDNVRVENDGDGTFRLIVTDVEAFTLPLTGGFGNVPWILGGLLLAGAALAVPLVRVRREQYASAARA